MSLFDEMWNEQGRDVLIQKPDDAVQVLMMLERELGIVIGPVRGGKASVREAYKPVTPYTGMQLRDLLKKQILAALRYNRGAQCVDVQLEIEAFPFEYRVRVIV